MTPTPRFLPPPIPDAPGLPEQVDGSVLGWVDRLLSRISPTWIERGSVLVTLALGMVHFALGPDLFFSFFYLAPIAATAWYGTDRAGYFVCFLAVGVWYGATVLSGATHGPWPVALWNGGLRLGMFLVVAALTLRLRESLELQRKLASQDHLTGLANTRAFLDELGGEIERALRYGRIFSVAYLDLDHFKEVNDSLGHAEGDEVLRVVARVMKETMRSTDLMARLGGDEFAILLPETPFAQAEGALAKLRDQVQRAVEEGGWPVTLSVGAVTFEAPVDTADHAIRIADRLMYEVKAEGRDGIRHILWTGEDQEPSRV